MDNPVRKLGHTPLFSWIPLVATLLFLALSCGQQGPLQKPEEPQAHAPTNLVDAATRL